MKVFLQYPWRVSDSQYYKSMVENPPKGVEFINPTKNQGMIINKKTFFILTFLKQKGREWIEKSNLPILNSKFTKTDEKIDLIHCAHCLSLNDSPWVADFESTWQMWLSGRDTKIGKKRVLDILKKENCKKIMTWTETTKKEFQDMFPDIKDKVEVVGHGQKIPKTKKIAHNEINLLFASRFFDSKGGFEALDAIDRLTKKYNNVNGIIVSQISKNIVEKYKDNKKIKFYPDLVPYEILTGEIMSKADILVYPGYSDTFGFTFTDSMSFGIPIVTVDGHARKDLVKDGKEGFVLKRPEINWKGNFPEISERENHIKDIMEKTSILIENKGLKEKMSRECLETVKNGRFSIKERNKNLKRIYEEALG